VRTEHATRRVRALCRRRRGLSVYRSAAASALLVAALCQRRDVFGPARPHVSMSLPGPLDRHDLQQYVTPSHSLTARAGARAAWPPHTSPFLVGHPFPPSPRVHAVAPSPVPTGSLTPSNNSAVSLNLVSLVIVYPAVGLRVGAGSLRIIDSELAVQRQAIALDSSSVVLTTVDGTTRVAFTVARTSFIGPAGTPFTLTIDDGALLDGNGLGVRGIANWALRLSLDTTNDALSLKRDTETAVSVRLGVSFPTDANAMAELIFEVRAELLKTLRVRILRIPESRFAVSPVITNSTAADVFVSLNFAILGADPTVRADQASVRTVPPASRVCLFSMSTHPPFRCVCD
jgi:hypothetical protein